MTHHHSLHQQIYPGGAVGGGGRLVGTAVEGGRGPDVDSAAGRGGVHTLAVQCSRLQQAVSTAQRERGREKRSVAD